jgi:hypothetical protein
VFPLSTEAPAGPVEITQDDPESNHPCSWSTRCPEHYKCGKPASYVILASCSICTAVVPRYLCASHAADMFPAYVRNGPWCRCNRHLPPHNTTGVRIRGL